MPFRTVSVTTTSKLVPGSDPDGFGMDVSVTNRGAFTAYLDNEQQGTTTTGYPLSPGSTIVWQEGQPLYVVAETGTATTVILNENSGNVFDAGAIASQILSQGLAVQIAAQVAISGAPSIDAPAILANDSWVTAAGVERLVGLASQDVAKYQSVTLYLIPSTAAIATAPVASGTIRVTHIAAGQAIDEEYFYFFSDNAVNTVPDASRPRLVISPKGDQLSIRVSYTAAGAAFEAIVVGSYRPRPNTIFYNGHGYWGAIPAQGNNLGDGIDGVNTWALGAQANAASWNVFPRLYSGPARLTFDSGAGILAGTVTVSIRDPIANTPIDGFTIVGAAGAVRTFPTIDLHVTRRPLQVRVTNNSGVALSAAATLTITQVVPV